MRVSVTEAKRQLNELVRRAEAGEEITLTRDGHAAVRLAPVKTFFDARAKSALLDLLIGSASAKASAGPDAARSEDFLYDDKGMPK